MKAKTETLRPPVLKGIPELSVNPSLSQVDRPLRGRCYVRSDGAAHILSAYGTLVLTSRSECDPSYQAIGAAAMEKAKRSHRYHRRAFASFALLSSTLSCRRRREKSLP